MARVLIIIQQFFDILYATSFGITFAADDCIIFSARFYLFHKFIRYNANFFICMFFSFGMKNVTITNTPMQAWGGPAENS